MKIKCFIFENNIWKRFGNWKRFMFISWKPLNFPHLSPSSTQPLYNSSFLSIYPFFFLLRVLAIVPDHIIMKYGQTFDTGWALREKCLYSEFFWSIFSRIRTRKTPNTDTFHAMWDSLLFQSFALQTISKLLYIVTLHINWLV